MRIGIVATLSTPVRASGAGSVESLVHLLARELCRLGHAVTVYAAAGSEVPRCTVVPVPGTYGQRGMPEDYLQCEMLNLVRAVVHAGGHDVLHTHGYLLGRLLEPLCAAPMVHTLHTQPYSAEAALAEHGEAAWLTAPSAYQWSDHPGIRPEVVPHAVDPEAFTFRSDPEARLCYLGRFLPGKGVLDAVRLARQVGVPLVLAGPESDYFRAVVRPHVDGRAVDYVGSVTGRTRDELLGGSAALVYPLRDGEPFGLVLAEAMTCGTPVLATPAGAVPEVVDDRVTGRVVPLHQLADALGDVLSLDRAAVRRAALDRFAPARMAAAYARVYTAASTAWLCNGRRSGRSA